VPQLKIQLKKLELELEKKRQIENDSNARLHNYKEQVDSSRRERVIFSNFLKNIETDIITKEQEFMQKLL
jgi:hypothetical protein